MYLKELVHYIHLNPLRAKIVKDLKELKSYPYCGHSVLLGKMKYDWQDSEYVLNFFWILTWTGTSGHTKHTLPGELPRVGALIWWVEAC